MCIRDRNDAVRQALEVGFGQLGRNRADVIQKLVYEAGIQPVSYTHLRAHETVLDIVCRLLLEKKKKTNPPPHTTGTQTEPLHILITLNTTYI